MIPALIYIGVPLLGLLAFAVLRRQLLRSEAAPLVIRAWFVLFATYGGVLLVVLTELFWRWSGAASLGSAYLVLIAPLLLPALGIVLWRRRQRAGYSGAPYIFCFTYPIIAGALGMWAVTSGTP